MHLLHLHRSTLKFSKSFEKGVPCIVSRCIWLLSALPWVPEVFLACGGIFGVGRRPKPRAAKLGEKLFARFTIKNWQKPETALEKSLAPRVCQHLLILVSCFPPPFLSFEVSSLDLQLQGENKAVKTKCPINKTLQHTTNKLTILANFLPANFIFME